MAIYDLVGVPFPMRHPLFAEDKRVTKMVERICSYIEIEADLDESMRVIEAIVQSQKMLADDREKYVETSLALFGGFPVDEYVCDSLLAHAVMNYGNAFRKVNGRTSLGDNVNKIFKSNEVSLHQFVVDLRDQYFAHRAYQANKHCLFVLNTPQGPIINQYGQRARLIVSKSVNISSCARAIAMTRQYVIAEREKYCTALELRLTPAQKEAIANGRLGDKYFEYESQNPWLLRMPAT